MINQFRFVVLCMVFGVICLKSIAQPIDRAAVVRRHTIQVNRIDSLSSLSVGNGNFAFTVDATGMQSFPAAYEKGVPLGTQSVWGWHSFPNLDNCNIEDAQKTYEIEGRKISYTVQPKEPERAKKAVEYFRVNPHRLQLGNIGLEITKNDGSLATSTDIKNINQQLDVFTGIITSKFTVDNYPVTILTVCHQQQDVLAFKIESPLCGLNRIAIKIRFPYPNGQFKDVGNYYAKDENHQSVISSSLNDAVIRRNIDTTNYTVDIRWSAKASIKKIQTHYFLIQPATKGNAFECSFRFSDKTQLSVLPNFESTNQSSILATGIN